MYHSPTIPDETTAGRKKSPAGSSGEGGVKYDHPEQGGH